MALVTFFKILAYLYVIIGGEFVQAASNDDFKAFMDGEPFASYNKKVFPRYAQTERIDVDIIFQLVAVTEFDELSGNLNIVGSIVAKWKNELLMWYVPQNYTISSLMLGQNYFWRPSIVLSNSVVSLTELGHNNYKIRIDNDGNAEWRVGIVSKTACAVDVSLYPFDTQTCEISFTPWGYTDTQVVLNTTRTEVDLTLYNKNVEWTLTSTSVESLSSASASYLVYTLILKRKPSYFLVNMIIPILILGILNGLVFLLPADSGERVGYAITSFLTFAVFLTMVSENLPKASDPMSLLCYYLTLMLVTSALSTLITIMTLRVYHQDNDAPVPNWLKHSVSFMTCKKCKKWCKKKPKDDEDDETDKEKKGDDEEGGEKAEETDSDEDESDSDDEENKRRRRRRRRGPTGPDNSDIADIEWKNVGTALDGFFFTLFLLGAVIIAGFFLIPLAIEATSDTTSS